MITTKALAEKMGGVSKHTVFYAADQFRWKSYDNPYGKGFVWDVTDGQIEDYKRIRAARSKTIEQRRAQLDDVIDLFDTATRGRTFARGLDHVLWGKTPSHVNVYEDVKEDTSEVIDGVRRGSNGGRIGRQKGQGKPRSPLYFQVKDPIENLIRDGYRVPKALRIKLLELCPDSFSLDERSFYRYAYEIAENLEIPVKGACARKHNHVEFTQFIVGNIQELLKNNKTIKDIQERLNLTQKEFDKYTKYCLTHDSITV